MSITLNDYCSKQENAEHRKGEHIDMTRKIDGMPILYAWELLPNKGCGRDQKSFYGKAHILSTAKGHYLMSYDTIVCGIVLNEETRDMNVFKRYWMSYSATTIKHINSFRYICNIPRLTKKEWESLEYNTPYYFR